MASDCRRRRASRTTARGTWPSRSRHGRHRARASSGSTAWRPLQVRTRGAKPIQSLGILQTQIPRRAELPPDPGEFLTEKGLVRGDDSRTGLERRKQRGRRRRPGGSRRPCAGWTMTRSCTATTRTASRAATSLRVADRIAAEDPRQPSPGDRCRAVGRADAARGCLRHAGRGRLSAVSRGGIPGRPSVRPRCSAALRAS